MNYFLDVVQSLGFHSRALRALAARRSLTVAILFLAAGIVAYILVRSSVYSALIRTQYVQGPPNLIESLLGSNLLQTLLFLTLVYVPALIALSNAFAGDGLGFSISRAEYAGHLSALLPLWAAIFLIAAPIQWLAPQFLILPYLDISFGMLWLLLSMVVYTVWAVRELNFIPVAAALGVFVLSWFTLPVFFVLTNFLLALPFFVVLPVLIIFLQKFRELIATQSLVRGFRQHLRTLMLNPRDADAHFQLGLLHFRSGHMNTARGYFDQALSIDPKDPDFHYYLGRIFEARGEWPMAAAEYEETYALNPKYGTGDIFREVGKGYLHTDRLDKALEFLQYFLERRGSDPEGRYWLAVALKRVGKTEEMRSQLNTVLDLARTSPRFFRKENRDWIYRSRLLLRGATE